MKLEEHGIRYNKNKKTYKYNSKKNRFKSRYKKLFNSKDAKYKEKPFQKEHYYEVELKVPRKIKKAPTTLFITINENAPIAIKNKGTNVPKIPIIV